jgi:molybdate transport system substrate-binding protein
MKTLSLAAVLALLSLTPRSAGAGEILVAAASDLTFVMPEIAMRFEKQTGNSVHLTFGSSGNFFAQIQNGAPFDVFLSADIDYPRKLEAAGLAQPSTLRPYGGGRLVLWAPKDSALNLERLGMNALLDPSVRRIAIANPAHAPYGRAAVAALQSFKLYERAKDRLVLGENISQAAQFVESGNAQIGILAFSIVGAPAMKDKGRSWEIPPGSYPRIEQAAVIPKSAPHPAVARVFLDFMGTAEIRKLLLEYGFQLPEGR